MNRNGRSKEYQDYRLIDFLEDDDFRRWIFSGERSEESDWEGVLMLNEEGKEARLILKSLKQHFDQHGLTAEEVERHLEQEIERYRVRKQSIDQNFTSPVAMRKQLYGIARAAAVLLLLAGVFYFLRWQNRPVEEYHTGFGERLTIELPDQSVIQLNSNSSLTWNRNWKKEGERKVHLNGEAFFDVKNLENMPFHVKTEDISIHVVGTQFNVNSRREKTRVFLEEGKVNVEIDRQPEEKYEMNPGEELVYQAEENKVEKTQVDVAEEVSGWKEGLLIFRDAPLQEVLKSISDIYGKEFIAQDSSLLSRNITTTIPLTNWEVSLTAVRLAMRLEAEEAGNTIRIKEKD